MDAEDINPETGPNGEEIWTVAGYMDWEGEYHDLEDQDFTSIGLDYTDIDLVTISWIDADDGTTQYARLEGPWEDYDDLEHDVMDYFDEGS